MTVTLRASVFQVNVWALHDPYVPAGEDKPFKSGERRDPRVLSGHVFVR